MNSSSARHDPRVTLAASVQERTPTQVSANLTALTEALDMLDKSLSTHAEKLEPVLSPCCPVASDANKAAPDEVLCNVADRLRTATRRLHNLRQQIEGITARAEA